MPIWLTALLGLAAVALCAVACGGRIGSSLGRINTDKEVTQMKEIKVSDHLIEEGSENP